MKKLTNIFLTIVVALAALSVNGQSIIDLRLNEILIQNEDNLADEYGRHPAWFEVFNTAYNSVNIGGCYLTDDTTGLAAAQSGDKDALNAFRAKCYQIPTGDPATLMNQRSCLVFYMDGMPTYGTFHVSFTNENTNYVALLGSDGKTLIDIMNYPDELNYSSRSYGCAEDGVVANNRDNSVLAKKDNKDVRTYLEYFTPGSNNKVLSGESKADKLIKNDPYGIMMALMSMAIVFTVLVVIFIVLKIFAYYSSKGNTQKEEPKKAKATAAPATGKPSDEELAAIALALDRAGIGANDEEIAAITMALYLYLDTQHDQESEVITFNTNNNSTWGQKHFNFKQNPR